MAEIISKYSGNFGDPQGQIKQDNFIFFFYRFLGTDHILTILAGDGELPGVSSGSWRFLLVPGLLASLSPADNLHF